MNTLSPLPTPPTLDTYNSLQTAYEHFNNALFGKQLPECLVTLQRKSKALGFFHAARFQAAVDSTIKTDEIALNPSCFAGRTTAETLSTLVHEMAHLWQQHLGKPSRGHHNKQWAAKMKTLGLHPSSTAQPGGAETGQSMSHYIVGGGAFDLACTKLLESGFELPYVESGRDAKKATKAAASKTKYTCPGCDTNAWAKPETRLICAECFDATGNLILMASA